MELAPPPKVPTLLLDDRVDAIARRACPSWLRGHADDISQITRLQVYRRARQEPSLEVTAAYVEQAVRHAVIDVTRRHLRRDALSSRYEPTVHGADPVDPEAQLAAEQLARRVRARLAMLPPERRQVVSLYLRGHGVSEIAQMLGCGRKRIDNLVHRGLATLRKGLTEEGFAPVAESNAA